MAGAFAGPVGSLAVVELVAGSFGAEYLVTYTYKVGPVVTGDLVAGELLAGPLVTVAHKAVAKVPGANETDVKLAG